MAGGTLPAGPGGRSPVAGGTLRPAGPGPAGPGPRPLSRRQLGDDAEEYLSWLAVEKGRAPNTLVAYRRDLAAYEAWLAGRSLVPAQAGEEAVAGYVGSLRAGGRRPASVARAMAAVRGLHRFCLDEGRSDADPTTDVGTPPVPLGLPKALTEEEVEALLGAVAGDHPRARRDRAMLEVLYGSALRVSELVGLSLGDLVTDEGLLRVTGKGSKERVVPLGRAAAVALLSWLAPGGRPELVPRRWARRADAEAVFLNGRGGRLSRQGAWLSVHRYGDQVGLGDRLTPHVLRHSCATHMLDHGADIRVVQELLGHASITTTQVYTRVSTGRLRAAYTAAHPRAGAGAGRARAPGAGR
ncbi:MAG: site-specific tyrosine recombinase [Acidimicrobiales bacterium]